MNTRGATREHFAPVSTFFSLAYIRSANLIEYIADAIWVHKSAHSFCVRLYPNHIALFHSEEAGDLREGTPEEMQLHLDVMSYITNFIRTGKPGFDDRNTLEWPRCVYSFDASFAISRSCWRAIAETLCKCHRK